MTPQELKTLILQHYTAEEALLLLLQSSLIDYKKLKFKKKKNAIHPEILICMAAMDLGWEIAMTRPPDPDATVNGLTVGTPEYIDSILGSKQESSNKFQVGDSVITIYNDSIYTITDISDKQVTLNSLQLVMTLPREDFEIYYKKLHP